MTWLLLLLALTVLVAALRLASAIRRDGLGTRSAPPSHAAWADAAQNLPSRPY